MTDDVSHVLKQWRKERAKLSDYRSILEVRIKELTTELNRLVIRIEMIDKLMASEAKP